MAQSKPRHFLTLLDLSPSELQGLIARAIELKAMHAQGDTPPLFPNKVLGMIFEKSSTRTRVSRSEEHTSELQSRGHLVCRLLLDKKNDAHGCTDIYQR